MQARGRPLELVRVRGTQRDPGHEGRELTGRSRRRGGRGRGRGRSRGGASSPPPPPPRRGLWAWLLQSVRSARRRADAASALRTLTEQEERALDEFGRHFGITFNDPALLKLALTHRSYLSVTGQGPRESNERLEFLGDSVLGLVTSEFLYRQHPNEHEGQLTKTKSLLVSKAILSRRALAMGLGRFVLMSHSEVESGGRQRLSILADAFEAVLGAVYLDQGFEAARQFIDRWLLRDSSAITSDKRHTNYKSHLQEYVQSTFHTHPVYRIRSEYGPDHSKHFNVEVMVGRRVLGSGKGRNKKEAEQAAARDALDQAGALPRMVEHPYRAEYEEAEEAIVQSHALADEEHETEDESIEDAGGETVEVEERPSRRRGRRGGRGRRSRESAREAADEGTSADGRSREARDVRSSGAADVPAVSPPLPIGPRVWRRPAEEFEEIGRPEGPLEEPNEEPYEWAGRGASSEEPPAVQLPREEREPEDAEALDEARSRARESWAREESDTFGGRERAEEAQQLEEADARGDALERARESARRQADAREAARLEAETRERESELAREDARARLETRREPEETLPREAPVPPPALPAEKRPAEPQFGRRGSRARSRSGGR